MATDASGRINRSHRSALLRGIYVVLNAGPRVQELARVVLGEGVRIVQYRAKDGIVASDLERLRRLTNDRGALLILNDDWRAAQAFDCDGVHLGPDDDGFARVSRVREALPDGLIGLSCGTIEEIRAANAAGADYFGIGSVYATSSKSDAGAPIGIGGLHSLVRASTVPVAAIGGITAATIPQIRTTGAAMAAVISAVCAESDPARATADLIVAWNA